MIIDAFCSINQFNSGQDDAFHRKHYNVDAHIATRDTKCNRKTEQFQVAATVLSSLFLFFFYQRCCVRSVRVC